MPRFSIVYKIIHLCSLIGALSLVTACGGGAEDETSSSEARSSQSIIVISSSQSSSSLSSSSTLSSRSSSSPSSRSSSSSSSSVGVPVTIEWSHPAERENGNYLELSEIGGYEIRVYDPRTTRFTYYDIKGNSTTRYSLSGYNTGMNVEIAVYDTAGLYSEYVSVTN